MTDPQDNATPDLELAGWNDRMYRKHGTPYDRGLTRRIQLARVAAVMRLADVKAADAVLELGCEAGRLLHCVPSCRRLVGADVSEVALADARSLFAENAREAEFRHIDAQQALPFAPGEFDAILCSEMLEHVGEPRAVLESIHAIAAADTRVVLSVPIEAPKVAIKAILSRLGLLEVLFPGVEPGQSEWHLQSFSRRLLRELSADLFRLERERVVWGCHYVARLAKR